MVSVQRHVALLRGALRPGETERLWVRAERRPHGQVGALLLSDRRLLFSGIGFVQQSQEAWPLVATAAEGLTLTGAGGELRVAVPGAHERFRGRSADLQRLAALLGTAPEAPSGDLTAALERLAALHVAGALTDAEFDRAKRRLLDEAEPS